MATRAESLHGLPNMKEACSVMISYRKLAMRVLNHTPMLGGGGMARPLAQRLAALTVVAALMAGLSVPAFAATYNIGDGSITIEANGDGTAKVTQNETVNEKDDDVIVKGSGETTSNVIEVINNTEDDLKITLSDVDIADTKGKAPLSVSGTGDTTIELDGNNSLTGSGWSAGLERNEEKDAAGNVVSGKLTIQDENKNGSLEATGNYGGAGIGGGNLKNSGEIEITGGTITATGALDGAGIGGGGSGGDGTVTISGGNITARGGSSDNPKAICGAGIGGGGGYGNATVTITDNAKVDNATGGEGAAGIGSGVLGDVTVNISGNATVNAEGGANGAGIGGGYASAGDVTIEGGTTVKAEGGVGGGAGIGGGADLEADEDTQNRVTIRSSEDGSPDVTAVGGAPEPGEDGTELSKGGAGIGSGALIGPDEGDREADAIISIEGKVTIKSTAGKDNAAIGANGEEQVIEGLLPGSSIDRRDADGNDISLPGDKQQPADSSEQNSDALEGLTVTDAAGKTLPYTVEWQGSTVVVTAKYPFASLQMTHETLLQLQKQGAQTLRFCTESRTASASVAELLNVSTAGAKIVWSHDGAASALQVNGADHNELLK